MTEMHNAEADVSRRAMSDPEGTGLNNRWPGANKMLRAVR